VLHGKFSFSGASIAHIGFGFILLGVLISNANSRIISKNRLNIDLGKDFPNNENIMLAKGDTLQMDKYFVTYSGREKEGVNVYFNIDYFKLNKTNGTLKKAFTLKPIIQLNERMGNAAEPATKWFPDKDIYTHITYANLDEYTKKESFDEYDTPVEHEMATGDTLATSNSLVVLSGLARDTTEIKIGSFDSFGVTALLKITDVNKKVHEIKPLFLVKDRVAISKNYFVDELGLKFRFTSINPDNGKIKIEIAEKKSNKRDFIIMKAIIFPHINLLWIGCILMITGTWIVSVKRFKEYIRYTGKN
jgi:cytochrome c-type biogenesis protein CcmF